MRYLIASSLIEYFKYQFELFVSGYLIKVYTKLQK